MKLTNLEFFPLHPKDNDRKGITMFNMTLNGLQFWGWKIRRENDGRMAIRPPYHKIDNRKVDLFRFEKNEDFFFISKTVIQAAKEQGILEEKHEQF